MLQRTTPSNPCPPSYGLNSKLVKTALGNIEEQVWKQGGMYGEAIDRIVYWLTKAMQFAENEKQQEVIGLLISYYRTGDLKTFDSYSIEWLKEHAGDIDFINGFIEVYGDPLASRPLGRELLPIRTRRQTSAHTRSAPTPNGLRTTRPWTLASRRKR